MFKEETKCREKMSIRRFYPTTYDGLVRDAIATKMKAKLMRMSTFTKQENQEKGVLQGLHTYNVLANKTYYDKYMYLPYSLKDRKTFIVSMYKDPKMKQLSIDVVRATIDLAYMPTG